MLPQEKTELAGPQIADFYIYIDQKLFDLRDILPLIFFFEG